jgi:hypothetical protein
MAKGLKYVFLFFLKAGLFRYRCTVDDGDPVDIYNSLTVWTFISKPTAF